MPETAPLDVNETTVGYELDSITLRNICSVRYVRHHEWLDHLLESPMPTMNIVPIGIGSSFDYQLIKNRISQLEGEIAAIDAEDFSGTKFYTNEKKTVPIVEATRALHDSFGSDHTTKIQESVESQLGLQIRPETTMFPVPITYDRNESELARAEQRQKKLLESEQEADDAGADNAGVDADVEEDVADDDSSMSENMDVE